MELPNNQCNIMKKLNEIHTNQTVNRHGSLEKRDSKLECEIKTENQNSLNVEIDDPEYMLYDPLEGFTINEIMDSEYDKINFDSEIKNELLEKNKITINENDNVIMKDDQEKKFNL